MICDFEEILEAYMDENHKFDLKLSRPLVYSHGEYSGIGKPLGTFGYSVRKKAKKSKKTGRSGRQN